MFRKLGLLGVLLACFSLAGGQWTVLQGVAWAEMLRQYTRDTGSFAVAVGRTFDGGHPCALCREITSVRAKERPGSPAAPSVKKDVAGKALLTETVVPPVRRIAIGMLPRRPAVLLSPDRTEPPPTPPPRGVAFAAWSV